MRLVPLDCGIFSQPMEPEWLGNDFDFVHEEDREGGRNVFAMQLGEIELFFQKYRMFGGGEGAATHFISVLAHSGFDLCC